jgi:hypothetical protein
MNIATIAATVTGSMTYDLQASGTAGAVSGNRRPLSRPRVAGRPPGARRDSTRARLRSCEGVQRTEELNLTVRRPF